MSRSLARGIAIAAVEGGTSTGCDAAAAPATAPSTAIVTTVPPLTEPPTLPPSAAAATLPPASTTGGDRLRDDYQFAYVSEIVADGSSITLDYAEFLSGDEADAAAVAAVGHRRR